MEEYEELDMVNTKNTNNANEVVMLFFIFFYSIHSYPLTSNSLFYKLMQSDQNYLIKQKDSIFGTPIPN